MTKVASSEKAEEVVSQTIGAYFCRMADTIGLPRSVALIYHALFTSEEAVCFSDIVERTGLSKASASTGLSLLERMRGIERVIKLDDRRTFYRPELSLRRLVSGFVEESVNPGLEAGQRLLDEAHEIAEQDEDLSPVLAERLASLRHWHELTQTLLPAIRTLDPG